MAITPYLYYSDVDSAVTFLSKAFGFRVLGPRMRGADGRTAHASMKLSTSTIMMGCPGPAYRNPKQLGQATQCLYVDVADVDKHFARAQKAGATISETPADTPYGHRRYAASDPEGHHWAFAQPIRRKKTARRAVTRTRRANK